MGRRKSLLGRCKCVFLMNPTFYVGIVAYRKNKSGKWDSTNKYGEINPNRTNEAQNMIEYWLSTGQVVKQGRRRFKKNPAKQVVKSKVVKVAAPVVDYDKPFDKPKLISCNGDKYSQIYLWVHTSPNNGIAIHLADGSISKSVLYPKDVLNLPDSLMECKLIGDIKIEKA